MKAVVTLCLTVLLGLFPRFVMAAEEHKKPSEKPPTVWKSEESEWMPLPDIFPKGGKITVLHGDPAAGPADFYFRLPAGYTAPWHFHTPIERVFVDRGDIQFNMRGGESTTLSQGGYIRFPERVPHQVICMSESECLFYLSSDGPFDIHLVDKNWNVTQSWKAGK